MLDPLLKFKKKIIFNPYIFQKYIYNQLDIDPLVIKEIEHMRFKIIESSGRFLNNVQSNRSTLLAFTLPLDVDRS